MSEKGKQAENRKKVRGCDIEGDRHLHLQNQKKDIETHSPRREQQKKIDWQEKADREKVKENERDRERERERERGGGGGEREREREKEKGIGYLTRRLNRTKRRQRQID